MKWGVQHVRVTLESDSGETVVIEQSPDGRVKCEPSKPAKSGRAAGNAAPPKATEAKAAAAPKAAKPKEDKRAGTSVKAEKTSKPAAPKAQMAERPRFKKVRRGALKWLPVLDHDYEGFVAMVPGGGKFKALIAKDTQWALFYEFKGSWPKHIACFRAFEKAKERAQELYDSGWPESEFGPITAGQIARACPATPNQDEGDEEMATTPKAEEKPAEPAPKVEEEPAANSDSDAERDKKLMSSFTSELDTMLDEDEDD